MGDPPTGSRHRWRGRGRDVGRRLRPRWSAPVRSRPSPASKARLSRRMAVGGAAGVVGVQLLGQAAPGRSQLLARRAGRDAEDRVRVVSHRPGPRATSAARPHRASWTSVRNGLRRSGPWRPAGTPSVMHADRATASGIAEQAAQLGLDGVVPAGQRPAVAEGAGGEQQVLARRVHRRPLVRGWPGGSARGRRARSPGRPRRGRRSAASPPASGPAGEPSAGGPSVSRSARLTIHDCAERPLQQLAGARPRPGRRGAAR